MRASMALASIQQISKGLSHMELLGTEKDLSAAHKPFYILS
jgi:hypothetical protein